VPDIDNASYAELARKLHIPWFAITDEDPLPDGKIKKNTADARQKRISGQPSKLCEFHAVVVVRSMYLPTVNSSGLIASWVIGLEGCEGRHSMPMHDKRHQMM